MTVVAVAALILAAGPALLFVVNLFVFHRPAGRRPPPGPGPRVSVVIPARNEAENIRAAALAVLHNDPLELIVVDDQSEDDTPVIVRKLAAADPRVRYVSAAPLPAGWCGKQHACQIGADHARGELILFLDADVRVAPGALAELAAGIGDADLLSGFPRQLTGTWLERLLIPLIHFVLLGFLPIPLLRRSRHPAYAAGCGQLMLVRRGSYVRAGGHAAVRSSRMDGVTLPRAFRRAGLVADLCDATALATCRMYHGAREVWTGLAKNANEGLGTPAGIAPITVVLAGGQVLPFALLPFADPPAQVLLAAAGVLAWLPRYIGVVRFRQSPLGAVLHPVGIMLLLAIQWYALGLRLVGCPPTWRGRACA